MWLKHRKFMVKTCCESNKWKSYIPSASQFQQYAVGLKLC